mmetsp:Transcript_82385/g.150820  ORF Transcript_82385/g.150820 Transcript_82385/m.150820 type:complete len:626 (-) Transcript_82385:58-1935(-)
MASLVQDPQASKEAMERACRILPTEKAIKTLEVIEKLTRNVVSKPRDDKFRRFSLTNKAIKAAVVDVPNAIELLKSMGWVQNAEEMVLPPEVQFRFEVHVVGLIDAKDFHSNKLKQNENGFKRAWKQLNAENALLKATFSNPSQVHSDAVEIAQFRGAVKNSLHEIFTEVCDERQHDGDGIDTIDEDDDPKEIEVSDLDLQRQKCQICLQEFLSSAGDFDVDWRIIKLSCCAAKQGLESSNNVCRGCLGTNVRINGTKCPLDPSHKLDETAAHAACPDIKRWMDYEKTKKAEELRGRCLPCTNAECHHVMELPPAGIWSDEPWAKPCPGCSTAHCGRCGVPWGRSLRHSHLCHDLRQGEPQAHVLAQSLADPIINVMKDAILSLTQDQANPATHDEFAINFRQAAEAVGRGTQLDANSFGLTAEQTDRLKRILQSTLPAERETHAVALQWLRETRLTDARERYRETPAGGHLCQILDLLQLANEESGVEGSLWETCRNHRESPELIHAVAELANQELTVNPRLVEDLIAGRIHRLRIHRRTVDLDRDNVRQSTRRELRILDEENPVKNCPSCHHPTQRDGGCNMVRCSICSARWCFVCHSVPHGEQRCSDFRCMQTQDSPPMENS